MQRVVGRRSHGPCTMSSPPQSFGQGPIHHLLARCEQLKLLVTTNHDDLIEQALREAGRQFHLVVDTGHRSKVQDRDCLGRGR